MCREILSRGNCAPRKRRNQRAAPAAKQTLPPVIDEQAGTVTIMTTYGGLFQKLSITRGPPLIRDAGPVTFVDVFEYTGDPNDPVGDLMSETLAGLHGPHPDLLTSSGRTCTTRRAAIAGGGPANWRVRPLYT